MVSQAVTDSRSLCEEFCVYLHETRWADIISGQSFVEPVKGDGGRLRLVLFCIQEVGEAVVRLGKKLHVLVQTAAASVPAAVVEGKVV